MFPPEYRDLENPPEYHVTELGSKVSRLDATSPKSQLLRIDLNKKEALDPTTWYSQGSAVTGVLVVTPSQTIELSHLTVTLFLNENVHRFIDSASGGYRIKRSTAIASKKVSQNLWPENDTFHAGNEYSFDFELQFPLTYLQPVSGMRITLPPTIGAQTEYADTSSALDIKDCSARVLYTVESQLVKKTDSTIGPIKALRYVRFSPINTLIHFDRYLAQLGLDQHIYHQENDLIQGIFSRKIDGKMHTSAHSLQMPMVIGSNTSVKLQFKAHLSREGAAIPDLKRIAVILDIYTISAAEPWKTLPTLENLRRGDHTCFEQRQLSKRDSHKMAWKKTSKDTFASEIIIPVTIPQDNKFSPSFYTATVFRQYKLRFQAEFHKHRPIKFIVPLWLERDQCISSLASTYSSSTFSSTVESIDTA